MILTVTNSTCSGEKEMMEANITEFSRKICKTKY